MFDTISIVVPAYNESATIKTNIEYIYDYMKTLKLKSFEIIVVNDGSKDDTFVKASELKEKIKELKVLDNITNKGKGYSVKHGVSKATGDLICFTDADLSTPVEEIGKAIQIIETEKLHVLIGSRKLKESNIKTKQPIHRVIMGKVFGFLANSIVPIGNIKDTQCGFKCFSKESAKKIFPEQKMERFSFDVELLYLAKLNGYKIYEMPVTWIDDRTSTVNPIKDSISMFNDLWRIRNLHKKVRVK